MGIDGIGKGGAPPLPRTETGGTGDVGTRPAERAFEVHAPKAELVGVAGAAAASAAAPGPLEQLRAGKIDVERYVDLKVDEATAHLHGVGDKELGAIKSMLRAQVVSDPALAELVTQAAGHAPKSPVA